MRSAGAHPGESDGLARDQRGWTLMELMVVTSFIAILAAIAIPQYTALATQMRTSAAAARVLSDVNHARVMSLRTGAPHYVSVTPGPGINYKVQRSAFPPAIAPDTDPEVRTSNLTTSMPGIAFSLNGVTDGPYGALGVSAPTPAAPMVFSSRGLPTTPGTFFIASTDGKNALAVAVTGAGRTRLFRRADGVWK